MIIENIRSIKSDLLFTVKNEMGDPNIGGLCRGCPLESLGCSRQFDTFGGKITALVNLDAYGVRLLVKDDKEVNCGATDEIKSRA